MSPDLEALLERLGALPASELDAAIEKLVAERASRPEGFPDKAPPAAGPVQYPRWWVQMLADGSALLRLRLEGLGWIDVGFNPPQRAQLAAELLKQAMLFPVMLAERAHTKPAEAAAPPAESGIVH
jgi:hypothetical protein